jgi:hypothetical protein
MQCCPKDASRQLLRNVYEEARDVARAIARTEAFEQSCRDRKQTRRNAVRSSQAHFAAGPLRLRGHQVLSLSLCWHRFFAVVS